ncbi:MAG: hypothetical protein JSC188_000857 [Candidatus Tokpelaia sp. JSC188]|nr:MAG: hypothetical protein JSC188_000857 [Candidatus Tokpelaia sp. JSC188]
MKRRFFITSMIFIVLAVLSACRESPPKLSDEQVLNVFGEKSIFASNDTPATISKRTEECARVLSGLDESLYRDMPKEMLGSFKTECRKDFQETVINSQRNTVDLKLEHLENAKLAEQITRVRAQSLAAEEAWKKAKKLAEDQKIIVQAKEKAKLLETTLESKLEILKKKCNEWETTMLDLNEKKLIPGIQFGPDVCTRNHEEFLRSQAKRVIEEVSKLEAKPDSIIDPAVPYFGAVDPEAISEDLKKVEKSIAQIKAEAEERKEGETELQKQ